MNETDETTIGMDIEVLALMKGLSPPAEAAPDTNALVRYLCQACSAEAAHQVERRMVGHPPALRRLRETRSALDRLQAMPWPEVVAQSERQEPLAEVARAWITLATERSAKIPAARETWLAQGWSGMRRQAAAGVTEAQAAWAAFLEFGAQLKAQWAISALAPAHTRSAGRLKPAVVGAWPEGVEVLVASALVEDDGTLKVSIIVQDGQGERWAALSGTPVVLSFQRDNVPWPLAVTTIAGDRATWTLPGFGAALDLPVGPLPQDCLHITLGSLGLAPRADPRPLFAVLLDSMGQPVSSPPVEIEMWGVPTCEAEHLQVRIAIPDWVRAVYPAHRLRLERIVTEGNAQCLGLWPLAEWDDAPRTLSVPASGFTDKRESLDDFVRARLQAP